MEQDNILIVDDEKHVRTALRRALLDGDYNIQEAECGLAALDILNATPIKVIVSDERMPGMQGSELLTTVALRWPETVRILLTGQASLEAAVRAVNQGEVYRFLIKPWNDLELRLAIQGGIEHYDLEMKNRKLLALVRSQGLRLQGRSERAGSEAGHCDRGVDGSFRLPELSEAETAALLRECGIDPEGL